jgi:hypothetical protein
MARRTSWRGTAGEAEGGDFGGGCGFAGKEVGGRWIAGDMTSIQRQLRPATSRPANAERRGRAPP